MAADQIAEPQTYQIQGGDSLSAIALEIYGDASLWQGIYQANLATIGSNPDLILIGDELIIPPLETAGTPPTDAAVVPDEPGVVADAPAVVPDEPGVVADAPGVVADEPDVSPETAAVVPDPGVVPAEADTPAPAPDWVDNPTAVALADSGLGGQCTYYAAARHDTPWVDDATPGLVGNANQWYANAQAAGLETTDANTPVVGSIACFNFEDLGFGHVAIVEEVRADGSFVVSEMNVVDADPWGSGSGIVSTSVHQPGEANLQGFIV